MLDFVRALPPPDFAALQSSDGRRWIEDLPSLADEVCRAWRLAIDAGQLHHGYHAVVVPVSGDDTKWVLKLAWPPSSIVDESIALRSWNGRGAAQLGRADLERGVLLRERLDADYSVLRESW
ncbi:MAG TPA: aminoglycoside phosphotransferase family protein [Acidimicrobiales bacterium]|nr:aminoglycoside phosphotransferase family protein [Acidimicrobiales bacterium]